MATQYLIIDDKQAAKLQSEDWWNKVLGRPKRPEDVTRYLVGVIDHPTDNVALVTVDDNSYALITPLLTPAQLNALNSNLRPASDPAVIQFLTDVQASLPELP